jgi:hypothetical protein
LFAPARAVYPGGLFELRFEHERRLDRWAYFNTRASLRSAIDAKCRDCGAVNGGAHWRLHVAACTVTGCPLWSVRPLPKPAQHWLATRDPDDLPVDWARKSIDAAIKSICVPVTMRPGAAMSADQLEGLSDKDHAAATANGRAK